MSSGFLISLLLGFLLNQKGVVGDLKCGARGIQCISTTSYRSCWYVLWYVEYGTETYTCNSGLECEQETGVENCVAPTAITTTTTSTTVSSGGTSAPLAASCGTNKIHCFNTTTYRTCQNLLGVILYTGDYVVCGTGTTCSENSGTTNCVTTTTTVSSVTDSAKCNQTTVGKRWPAEYNNQYYQCYLVTWNFMNVLQNCTSGEIFNAASEKCVVAST